MHTHCYRITVRGALGAVAHQAFEGFDIETEGLDGEINGTRTSLIASLDQAALHSALNRIQSLGLELVGLARIDDR